VAVNITLYGMRAAFRTESPDELVAGWGYNGVLRAVLVS
jgi:hypothetical protein